jgi:hypothetical protein
MRPAGGLTVDELSLARAILEYLSRHPHAKDTREGIATWWLQQQQIEQAVMRISRVMEFLASRDFLVKRRGPDLRVYYELNQRRLAEIGHFLEEPEP